MRLERTRDELGKWGATAYTGTSADAESSALAYAAALAELERAELVIAAARVRAEAEPTHSFFCGAGDDTLLKKPPCSCGQNALADALAAFGSGEGDTA